MSIQFTHACILHESIYVLPEVILFLTESVFAYEMGFEHIVINTLSALWYVFDTKASTM